MRKGSDTDPLKQFVWDVRYIDALLLRWYDADTNGSAVTHYAMHDAQFNITGLIAGDGNVVERYEYDAYGQRTVLDADFSEDADNTSDFDFQFGHQGLMHDAETGLIHNRNRMRHPTLGRFMQRDPLGYVDGGNLLAAYFVLYGTVDPLGLWSRFPSIASVTLFSSAPPPGWMLFDDDAGPPDSTDSSFPWRRVFGPESIRRGWEENARAWRLFAYSMKAMAESDACKCAGEAARAAAAGAGNQALGAIAVINEALHGFNFWFYTALSKGAEGISSLKPPGSPDLPRGFVVVPPGRPFWVDPNPVFDLATLLAQLKPFFDQAAQDQAALARRWAEERRRLAERMAELCEGAD